MALAVKARLPKTKAQCSPKNAEAGLVAAWAYRNLRQNKSERFPYVLQTQCSPPGRVVMLVPSSETPKPFTVAAVRQQVAELNELAAAVVREAEETSTLDKPGDTDELAKSLGQVVKHANALLVQLAEAGNEKAVERLAAHALGAAIALLKLTRSNLDLVKSVARQWGMWPVAYNPHRDSKREMEAMIRKLEVGHAAPENVQGKWSNEPTKDQPFRPVLGTFAFRMMQNVLRELHISTVLRNRLFLGVREDFSLVEDAMPKPMTKEEKAQLVAQGWPAWIVDLVNLPPFSNESAEAWFEVGWAALKQAAGGKVANIPELKPIGLSRAEHWRRNAFSKTIQESQREGLIHERLCDAFLARFKVARKI